MSTQFVIDDQGNKVAALIPIAEYEELMEDLVDLAAVAEQRDEEGIPLEEVKNRLLANGILRR